MTMNEPKAETKFNKTKLNIWKQGISAKELRYLIERNQLQRESPKFE